MLEVDHPADHTASRVVMSWVDETSRDADGSGQKRGPSEPKDSHVVALGLGVVLLLFTYMLSFGADLSTTTSRSVHAMTVGPIVLISGGLAMILGLYGIMPIAEYRLRERQNADFWLGVVLIGWFVASTPCRWWSERRPPVARRSAGRVPPLGSDIAPAGPERVSLGRTR